ncbi:phage tail sheath subtilisin-like domain-containing protein [Lacticaseibacillus sharpeae]|uniref:Sheath tail protein n=1 Tax=Lacticaseibacillus sharpeae JCM 1186 = DSM 20505 TaxID=1291052 RepID=A0A0R1ZI84_9LACO|nr:phage tail sheath subtilisin-like domain-containing protein [Lacticaseibacillus sharpeae]KRM54622.1 sheath tail protein [Lacticaseibacillus sharpeae JCM 1186 = DSM 20505]
MAGGTFTSMSKRQPGAYINVIAPQKSVASAETTRGVVFFVGGNQLGWGKTGVIPLNAGSNFRKLLGLDIYSDLPAVDATATKDGATVTADAQLQSTLVGLRETLKAAQTVLFYNINDGSKATFTDDTLPWKVEAAYAGDRGNSISISVAKNPADTTQTVVKTLFGTLQVDAQTITKASQLASNDYVNFTVTEAAKADDGAALLDGLTAGVTKPLVGGTSNTGADIDTDAMIAEMEVQEFNTMTAAGYAVDAKIHQLLVATAKRLRDEEGQKVQAVIPDGTGAETDYEGVIVVGNGVVLEDGDVLSASQAAGYVAGAEAAAAVNQSLTFAEYPGASDVNGRLTSSGIDNALASGLLVFAMRTSGAVVIEQDINSLITYGATKSQVLSKNRTLRVIDDIANNSKETFESSFIGKVNNDSVGRDLFKGNRIEYLNGLVNAGAIQAFDSDAITVAQGDELDQIQVQLAITPIDAMEKLYMTVTV